MKIINIKCLKLITLLASFTLPKVNEKFDTIEYVELNEEKSLELIEKYNIEGDSSRLQIILDKRSKHNDENSKFK